MTDIDCKDCKYHVPINGQCTKHKRHIGDVQSCSYGNPSLVDDSLWANRCKKACKSNRMRTEKEVG